MRATVLAALAAAVVASAKRPNILMLHCDSLDGRLVTDEDSPVLMPNYHKLMQRGTTFRNTYAASPECNPSRS